MESTKTWTWSALYEFSNAFNTYEVGDQFVIDRNFVHSPQQGDIIRVIEFDLNKMKRLDGEAIDHATGREMVWECIEKRPDTVSFEWGEPKTVEYGKARFKILSKTVSEFFDPKSFFPL